MSRPDVIIIGTGMGGLVCAGVLVQEGYRVCLIEKNTQIGGCLQVFARDKVVFDSGVHYLGGLDKGQNLYQIFRYLGLMEKLKLERMDEIFDQVLIEGDPVAYPLAQGFEAHRDRLVEYFPEEGEAIGNYLQAMRDTCDQFPMYRLTAAWQQSKFDAMQSSARQTIASFTKNEKLQAVLAGNNMLYAGSGDDTPFYVHALTVNSYIESAWRCVDGGSQIANLIAARIRAAGGEIIRNKEVKHIITREDRVEAVRLADGRVLEAEKFISNLPPAQTYRLIDSPLIRGVTRRRLDAIPNTVSSFIVNIVLKESMVPYVRSNYYFQRQGTIWSMDDYRPDQWPAGYAVYLSPSRQNPEIAHGMTIFAYMRYEEVLPWAETINTVARPGGRTAGYEAFKTRKAARLLDCVEERFPGLRNSISSMYTSTPLTYRDYIGSDDGNSYGYRKDYRDPYRTVVAPNTKLSNLFLTGQSLNLHGVLGTAISGLITAAELTGSHSFIENIRNA